MCLRRALVNGKVPDESSGADLARTGNRLTRIHTWGLPPGSTGADYCPPGTHLTQLQCRRSHCALDLVVARGNLGPEERRVRTLEEFVHREDDAWPLVEACCRAANH